MEVDVRYPIGKYAPQSYSETAKEALIADIRFLPEELESAINNLDEFQLNTPYREGGWTLKQVVHHVADSHINAFVRFKLGLTEDEPVIKPYEEKAWAELADVNVVPVNVSITLLHALHQRWVAVLKSITPEEFNREVVHPEHGRKMSLWFLLGMYAWHGKHHVAHIISLREAKNW